MVFLSTCKQVKFVYEAMRRLRPGAPLRCLHGGMKQLKRMAAFYDFSQARRAFLCCRACVLACSGWQCARKWCRPGVVAC